MTIQQLIDHLEAYKNEGFCMQIPIKFRNNKGEQEEIDYSVMSNDGTTVLLAEEWL